MKRAVIPSVVMALSVVVGVSSAAAQTSDEIKALRQEIETLTPVLAAPPRDVAPPRSGAIAERGAALLVLEREGDRAHERERGGIDDDGGAPAVEVAPDDRSAEGDEACAARRAVSPSRPAPDARATTAVVP